MHNQLKKNLEALLDEINEYNGVIDKAIDEAKSFLRQNGIVQTTTEFSSIIRDKVEHGFGYEQAETVDECIRKIKTFESVPDNLQDSRFSLVSIDMPFLNEIEGILTAKMITIS